MRTISLEHHWGVIRERISISGTIRPLESERALRAPNFPRTTRHRLECWVQRYIAGTEHHEKKYTKRIKDLAKQRQRAIGNLQHVRGSREDLASLHGDRRGRGREMESLKGISRHATRLLGGGARRQLREEASHILPLPLSFYLHLHPPSTVNDAAQFAWRKN